MRFEELCTLRMQYGEGTWLAPYREHEYAGFGTGKGDVSSVRGSAERCTGRIIRGGARISSGVRT